MEFKLQHQSFNEYLGLISFRIDWFDLLAVQGALKSLLQHQSLKASILWHSDFFIYLNIYEYLEGHNSVRWLDSITDSMDMNLRKLGKTVEDRGKPGVL